MRILLILALAANAYAYDWNWDEWHPMEPTWVQVELVTIVMVSEWENGHWTQGSGRHLMWVAVVKSSEDSYYHFWDGHPGEEHYWYQFPEPGDTVLVDSEGAFMLWQRVVAKAVLIKTEE